MSTELTTTNGAAVVAPAFSNEQRELVRNTVAQNATDVELDYFLAYCAGKGLDPFAKEAWFIKSKAYTTKAGKTVEARVQIMTGIDGFFRIANSHPAYDGTEHEYGPHIKVPVGNGTPDILAPEWVEAIVYRKDRSRPERRKVYWREYAQELVTYSGKLSTWAQKPTVMLEKCADATALRKAFPQELGDLRVPEEMPREYSPDEEERKTAAQIESDQRRNYIAKRTAQLDSNEYVIEFGSKKGSKVSEASNSIWLERHLAKHGDQIPEAGRKLIQDRIAVLKREHAQKVAEVSDEGYHPTPEEEAEILKAERAEVGDE